MKDIKTLYLTAKSSGKQADIAAYTESIQDLIENNPDGYISYLEYIISSDIGLQTIKPFIEKNGFPIACYDHMIECLNECIRKCEVYNKDSSIYKEMVEYFESFKQNNINCFMMFENYNESIDSSYVKTYYGKNDKGYQNRNLIAGMINKFGEAAIPDSIITAKSIGDDAVKTVLEFVSNKYNENCGTIYEWMLTVTNGISYGNKPVDVLKQFEEKCLSTAVAKIKEREYQAYRESVIMNWEDMMIEYTEDDIKSIQNLIAFKEYQMTWSDSLSENTTSDIQKEIYDLYEMMDGIIEEDVADSIIPMLPGNTNIKESLATTNTANKKTGEIPGYLAKNHDISYGEEDYDKKKSKPVDDQSDDDSTLDDFRRPSATEDKAGSASVLTLPSAYDDKSDDEPVSKSSTNVSEDDKRIINNYYYNYTNSLNKNTNSFNKDHSVRDDHSTTINSGEESESKYSLIANDEEVPNKDKEVKKESSNNPWELNIFGKDETILETAENPDLNKPKSDHPIKDILTDIDRATTKKQQEAKKKIQDIQNVGRVAMKPVNRTKSWINKLIADWKDADENNIKERMADPHSRNNLLAAIKKAIVAGSFIKAGILLNPVFLFLTATRGISKNKREFRIRNEMIGELKTEIEIIDTKIKDADYKGDNAEKYKLMRFKNELNKKLIRVGGTKAMSKMI